MKKFLCGVLTFLSLFLSWTLWVFCFADDSVPDGIEVDIPPTFKVNEPVTMKMTLMKDHKVFTEYNGFIRALIKDSDGNAITLEDDTIGDSGEFFFDAATNGVQVTQVKLINGWNYSIDFVEWLSDTQLWNVSFTVVDDTLKEEVRHISFLLPQNESTVNSMVISYAAVCPELPNSLWYLEINGDRISQPFSSNAEGEIKGTVTLEEGVNTLRLVIEKQGTIVWESDTIIVNYEDTSVEEIDNHIESFSIFSYSWMIEDLPDEWEHEFSYGDNLYLKVRLKDGYLYGDKITLLLNSNGVPLESILYQDADDPNFFWATMDNFAYTGDFWVTLILTYDANNREQSETHENYYYFVVRDLPPEPEKELIDPSLKLNPLDGIYYGDTVEFFATVDPLIDEVSLRFNDSYSITMEKTTVPWEFYRKTTVLLDGDIDVQLIATWSNGKVQNKEKILHFIAAKVTVWNVTFKLNDVSNTLTVDWEVLGDTEQFRVFYALSGENLENSVDVTGHTVVFENLDVTKEYQFQVVPLVWNIEEHQAATDIYVYRPPYTPTINTGTYSPTTLTEHGYACVVKWIKVRTEEIWKSHYLVWDPVPNAVSYIVYVLDLKESSSKRKVLETKDTRYEYPFDYTVKDPIYSSFWVEAVCSDNSVVPLANAQQVQVGPAENTLIIFLVSLLVYAGIRLYRYSE